MALNIPLKYSTISHISDIEGLKASVSLLPTGEFKSGLMRLKRATAEGGELSVQCVIKGINLAMNKHIDALCNGSDLQGGHTPGWIWLPRAYRNAPYLFRC